MITWRDIGELTVFNVFVILAVVFTPWAWLPVTIVLTGVGCYFIGRYQETRRRREMGRQHLRPLINAIARQRAKKREFEERRWN